ncbi:papain family cysteine protease domain-containing protein [Phthorimaea operculella]|nr:papain family cysteine protease domain-containing protein [Phthorimaea operculella]
MSLFYFMLLCALALSLAYVQPSPTLYDLEDAENIFENFINKYNKVYANEQEKQDRFNIFKERLAIVNKLRLEQPQASFDIQEHSDLTKDEFKSRYLGFLPLPSTIEPEKVTVLENLPDSFDWRDHHAVTPVKDQKDCSSCWAFSATGTMEGAYAIKHKKLLSFSEQQLIACDGWENGCNGGSPTQTINYCKNVGGIETESDYPYEDKNGTCKFDKSKVHAKIKGHVAFFFNGKDDETKQALINWGPMSIAVWGDSNEFYNYNGSGVIKCPSGTSDQINHAVLLVGYGIEKSTPYWLIKNSWGTGSGDKGYWKVMQGNNPCGMDYNGGVVALVD